jgi:hypothetical protein
MVPGGFLKVNVFGHSSSRFCQSRRHRCIVGPTLAKPLIEKRSGAIGTMTKSAATKLARFIAPRFGPTSIKQISASFRLAASIQDSMEARRDSKCAFVAVQASRPCVRKLIFEEREFKITGDKKETVSNAHRIADKNVAGARHQWLHRTVNGSTILSVPECLDDLRR